MYDQSRLSESIRFARINAAPFVIDVYPGDGDWARLFCDIADLKDGCVRFVPAEFAHSENEPIGRMRTLAKQPGKARDAVEVIGGERDCSGLGTAPRPSRALGTALRASNFAPQSCRPRAFSSSMVRIRASMIAAPGTSLSGRGGLWERGIVRGWGQPLTPRSRSGPRCARPTLLRKVVEPVLFSSSRVRIPVGTRENPAELAVAETRSEYWRRERDSNPRRAFGPYTLSRGAPSTTRPSLRGAQS
jgi:hypothetical protein